MRGSIPEHTEKYNPFKNRNSRVFTPDYPKSSANKPGNRRCLQPQPLPGLRALVGCCCPMPVVYRENHLPQLSFLWLSFNNTASSSSRIFWATGREGYGSKNIFPPVSKHYPPHIFVSVFFSVMCCVRTPFFH